MMHGIRLCPYATWNIWGRSCTAFAYHYPSPLLFVIQESQTELFGFRRRSLFSLRILFILLLRFRFRRCRTSQPWLVFISVLSFNLVLKLLCSVEGLKLRSLASSLVLSVNVPHCTLTWNLLMQWIKSSNLHTLDHLALVYACIHMKYIYLSCFFPCEWHTPNFQNLTVTGHRPS